MSGYFAEVLLLLQGGNDSDDVEDVAGELQEEGDHVLVGPHDELGPRVDHPDEEVAVEHEHLVVAVIHHHHEREQEALDDPEELEQLLLIRKRVHAILERPEALHLPHLHLLVLRLQLLLRLALLQRDLETQVVDLVHVQVALDLRVRRRPVALAVDLHVPDHVLGVVEVQHRLEFQED